MRKLKIVKIGNFNEKGWPINWEFFGADRPFISIRINAKGEYTLGGWTLTELREISTKEVLPSLEEKSKTKRTRKSKKAVGE